LNTVIALVGATVYPVSQPPIDDGVVLLRGDTIEAVGAAGEVEIPAGAEVVDLAGKVVIPGLVDLHSHIGGGRLGESLGVAQPGISAIDAIDPTHVSIQRAQAGGITTVNVMPGSGKLMGGQTAYLDLVDAASVDELLRCVGEGEGAPRWHQLCGGMKMANGTNPQGDGGDPSSRMGSAYLQRQTLIKGQQRLKALPAAEAEAGRRRWRKEAPPEAPEPDLDADALAQILAGERIVHFHSHRVDDIVTAARLRSEFDFRLVIHHGSEGFKVAELLAEEQIPVAINVLDTPGGKEETVERQLENPARLAAAGVTIALITDDPVQDSRLFLRTGGLAVRGGLSEAAALEAQTLTPAKLIDLGDRIGSLEPGKEADLVVLSGPPYSSWTLVEQTWNNGAVVFDRADPAQAFYATGGDDAAGRAP
jgi:imidazolonepropionase-like amidohydrolase